MQFSNFNGRNVHIGVTGSVAAFKALELSREFVKYGLRVSVSLTQAAKNFVTPLSFQALGVQAVYSEMFSRDAPTFVHLEPEEKAEAFLIAPSTANNIAKLANGLADDTLTCQALAFPGPILIAPSMNPNLWCASATQNNLKSLVSRGISIISPESGTVACGHSGTGRLAPVCDIFFNTLRAFSPNDMQDKTVLITLGSTREYWDPIRFWSNPSSGKMGAAMAVAAWLRGAQVYCICGPNQSWLPRDINCYSVTSAEEMFENARKIWPETDIACLCAAVSDYKPQEQLNHKFKKKDSHNKERDQFSLQFTSNPDILKTLGENKTSNQLLLGFAAETEQDLVPPKSRLREMREKLESKNLNLIVANLINQNRSVFGSSSNHVHILDENGERAELPLQNKADIAWKVWDWILTL